MTRMIHCSKLNEEAEGLDFIPYPGELGQKIFEAISKTAWQQWLNHQTMLINEYRLSMLEEKDQQFLEQEMKKFLFGEGSQKPTDYRDPDQ